MLCYEFVIDGKNEKYKLFFQEKVFLYTVPMKINKGKISVLMEIMVV